MNETHCTRVCCRPRLLVNSPGLRRLRFSFFKYSLVKEQFYHQPAQLPSPRITILRLRTNKALPLKSREEALLLFQRWLPTAERPPPDNDVVPCSEDGLNTAALRLSTTFSIFFVTPPFFHRLRFEMATKKPEKCFAVDACKG